MFHTNVEQEETSWNSWRWPGLGSQVDGPRSLERDETSEDKVKRAVEWYVVSLEQLSIRPCRCCTSSLLPAPRLFFFLLMGHEEMNNWWERRYRLMMLGSAGKVCCWQPFNWGNVMRYLLSTTRVYSTIDGSTFSPLFCVCSFLPWRPQRL